MNKKYLIIIAIILVIGIGGYFLLNGQTKTDNTQPLPIDNQLTVLPTASPSGTITPSPIATMESQLKIEDIVVGTGEAAVAGKKVTVNYSGTLTDGTKFDSSYDRGTPFSFNLGAGEVIKGWDQGVVGMKVGGKRKLTIPPDLGYGAAGAGGVILPNATLIFSVELLKVE